MIHDSWNKVITQEERNKIALMYIIQLGFLSWLEGTSLTEFEIIDELHKRFVINSNGVWEKR